MADEVKLVDADFVKYENSKSDEYIRLDTTIIGIDNLIAKASTAEEANALFKAKDVIYSQQKHFIYRQPVNDWISVKDRLPDECQEVLIYCPEFLEDIRKAFYTEGDFYIEKEDLIVRPAPNGYCTHWQPLPEPPKGE